MRITNKVMQNNALVNINRNKEIQDNLNTQIATGKKVNKPSEDPVVAIRALRLRSDVDQITQYLKKNVPDAISWLNLTETSIKTTISVLEDMIEKCERGASDQLKTEDRQTIIDSLNELYKEIYDTGNADYAGRYIFTGFRTGTSLTFEEQTKQTYQITELFDRNDLEQMSYIDTANLLELNEVNYSGTDADHRGAAIIDQDVNQVDYFRCRLSYRDLDGAMPEFKPDMTYVDDAGNEQAVTIELPDDTEDDPVAAAYKAVAEDPNKVIFIPSTGELVMGANIYDKITVENIQFSVSYSKTNWEEGDLRPQHYFNAKTTDEAGREIEYNKEYLEGRSIGQAIEYQVGFSQSIQVNTYAEDIYKHGIGRDVMEITDLANRLTEIENMKIKLESMSKDTDNYDDDQRAAIALDLEAAEKAESLTRDQLQKKFKSYISKMQSYLDIANEALTIAGNRSARLDLVNNRLTDQKETFDNLKSDNEDADETEVAVNLSSAELSYDAALMATGRMIQTTLLNYL